MKKWNVYFVKAGEYLKIGIAKDICLRITSLQTGNPQKIKLCGAMSNLTKDDALLIERKLHKFFKGYRLYGEWFAGSKFEEYSDEHRIIIWGDGGFFIDEIVKEQK